MSLYADRPEHRAAIAAAIEHMIFATAQKAEAEVKDLAAKIGATFKGHKDAVVLTALTQLLLDHAGYFREGVAVELSRGDLAAGFGKALERVMYRAISADEGVPEDVIDREIGPIPTSASLRGCG